jgi:hypothetical protein
MYKYQSCYKITRLRKWSVPSAITSLNQKDIEAINDNNPNAVKYPALEKPCIVNTPVVVKVNNDILVNKGQGDGETK